MKESELEAIVKGGYQKLNGVGREFLSKMDANAFKEFLSGSITWSVDTPNGRLVEVLLCQLDIDYEQYYDTYGDRSLGVRRSCTLTQPVIAKLKYWYNDEKTIYKVKEVSLTSPDGKVYEYVPERDGAIGFIAPENAVVVKVHYCNAWVSEYIAGEEKCSIEVPLTENIYYIEVFVGENK